MGHRYQQIEPGSGDGEPVTGIFSWVDFNLIVFKRRSIWIVNCNPTLAVSDFTVQPIHKSIGVRAYRTAAQVGSDVFVLTTDGVRSIRRTIAVTSQQDVGPSISAPVDDIIRRINPSTLTWRMLSHGTIVTSFSCRSIPLPTQITHWSTTQSRRVGAVTGRAGMLHTLQPECGVTGLTEWFSETPMATSRNGWIT
jgi:hypothetical protein